MVKEFTVHGCHRMVDHHRSHLLQYAHRHVVDSRAHASNHHSHHHQSLRDLFEEQKYSIKKNSKRNSLTWKIEKEAYHGSVDHHRANRYAFASLVALDPVKIYHVVDIHGNLDGVWKNTNEKYITNLATLISNPHVSLTYRANHHVRVGRLVDPNGNYRHHHHRSCVHHGICHAFYDRIHHQILPFSVNNFSKIFSV